MASAFLEYSPHWRHIGNADNPLIAVAYGAVALATIWALEYSFGRALYSTAKGILLSDTAAQVTYSSAGFHEFVRWIIWKPKQPRRLCGRALFGLFLRYFILIADLGILFLSLPRSIEVQEWQVGETQLSFAADAMRSEPKGKIFGTLTTGCKADAIPYKGFNPNAARQVCSIANGFSDTELPPDVVNNRQVPIMFLQLSDHPVLIVVETQRRTGHLLFLAVRFVDEEDGTRSWTRLTSNTTAFHMAQLPKNLHVQAAGEFMRRPKMQGCITASMQIPQGQLRGDATVVYCDNPANSLMDFGEMQNFLLTAGTKKVTSNSTRKIGTITRPRMGILPALIFLVIFSSIAIILRFSRGSQDLGFKQWAHSCSTARKDNVENPLFLSEDLELELLPDYTVHSAPLSDKTGKHAHV